MSQIARTPKQLGAILRRTRRNADLTQAQLGEKAGIWQETVSKIEGGQGATKVATIFDLLAALDLEIEIKPRSKGSAADIEDVF
ncbi:helix-turn-helix domain-containing protein [Roseospirillum parvum]|uniref:HTH-type transcriptional regulator / antitoxin HipB n=1 Tax=Roseospirillum parvum TaxID=83401 RepID=A0A1G8GLI3_9PROT|nr:helix-turn-helix domain-containing protein [Roseospirillum parvum]SDH95249.1 HTH-type transcriptional regulator / antitoxin HipB [Roseospirillum parvum]